MHPLFFRTASEDIKNGKIGSLKLKTDKVSHHIAYFNSMVLPHVLLFSGVLR